MLTSQYIERCVQCFKFYFGFCLNITQTMFLYCLQFHVLMKKWGMAINIEFVSFYGTFKSYFIKLINNS